MSENREVRSVRATPADMEAFGQAAAQKGLSVSAWMRQALRETALKEVYGEGGKFLDDPGAAALFRAVLVTLQIVNRDISEKDQRRFAEKAADQIGKIKNGE